MVSVSYEEMEGRGVCHSLQVGNFKRKYEEEKITGCRCEDSRAPFKVGPLKKGNKICTRTIVNFKSYSNGTMENSF